MNFYKYQNKLLSACERPPFKCADCHQNFVSPADLQCHVYDMHRLPSDGGAVGDVKREDEEQAEDSDRGRVAVAVECGLDGKTRVKTERRDNDDGDGDDDDDDDEELIDVGVNSHRAADAGKTSGVDDNADGR